MKLKIGFDIHGVIDRKPEVFAGISHALKDAGHEVHIITGASINDELKEQLIGWGVTWTNLFSITDYHSKNGTQPTHYEEGRPCFPARVWDRTKADYCREQGLHLHFDDTLEYGKYFREPTFFGFFPRLGK